MQTSIEVKLYLRKVYYEEAIDVPLHVPLHSTHDKTQHMFFSLKKHVLSLEAFNVMRIATIVFSILQTVLDERV